METNEITVQQLKDKLETIYKQRELIDEEKSRLREKESTLDALEFEALNILESLNLKSFDFGSAVAERRVRESVKVPHNENRELFFNYLKEKGIFESMVTVHSNTLNSWFKAEREIAVQEQRFLNIPGLEAPVASNILAIRKKKG